MSDTAFENSGGVGDSHPLGQEMPDTIVMDEAIDPNYVPGEEEVLEYVKWLGMDLEKDQDLFWIAREGLMAPLPQDWKPCRQKDTDEIYYFNFVTGESTWDHPCDGYYKRLYEEEKKKKEIQLKQSGDQKRAKAKQDVEQLLGKSEKKKKKSSIDVLQLGSVEVGGGKIGPGGKASPLGSLERKPLPGILGVSQVPPSLQSNPLGIADQTTKTKPPLAQQSVVSAVAVVAPIKNDSQLTELASVGTKSKSSSKLMAAVSNAESKNLKTNEMLSIGGLLINKEDSKLEKKVPESANVDEAVFGYQKSALGSIRSLATSDSKTVTEKDGNYGGDLKITSNSNFSIDFKPESKSFGNILHASSDDKSVELRDSKATLSDCGKVRDTGKMTNEERSTEHGAASEEQLLRSAVNVETTTLPINGEDSSSSPLPPARSSSPSSIFNKLRDISRSRDDLADGPPIAIAASQPTQDQPPLSPALVITNPTPTLLSTSIQRTNAEALSAMIASLEKELSRSRQKMEDMQKRHDVAEEGYRKREVDIRRRNSELENDLDALEQERRQLKKRIAVLEDEVSAKSDPAMTASTIECGPAIITRPLVHNEKPDISPHLIAFESKLKSLQETLDVEIAAHQSTRTQLQILESLKSDNDSEIADQLVKKQKLVDALEYETALLGDTQKKEMTRYKDLVVSLQSTISQYSTDVDKLRVRLDLSASAESKLERQVALLNSEVNDRDLLIQQYLTNQTASKSKISSLESELYAAKCSILTLEQQLQAKSVTAAATEGLAPPTEENVAAEAITGPLLEANLLLQKEASKLREEIAVISKEKNDLHVQSYRHEAELKHARAELNRIATVEENTRSLVNQNRLLEAQTADLQVENENLRATALFEKETADGKILSLEKQISTQVEEIQRLREMGTEKDENREKNSRELCIELTTLKSELGSAQSALEAEKVSSAQKEKKLRGYQEELLQLQKRLSLTASAPPTSPLVPHDGSYTATAAEAHIAAGTVAKLQASHEAELAAMRLEVAEAKQESSNASKENSNYVRIIRELEEQSSLKDEQIEKLDADLSSTQNRLHTTQRQYKEAVEAAAAASARLVSEATQLDSDSDQALLAAAAAADNRLKVVQLQFQEQLELCLTLEREKSVLESEKNKASSEFNSFKRKLDDLVCALNLEKKNCVALEESIADYKKRWLSAEATAGELKTAMGLQAAESKAALLHSQADYQSIKAQLESEINEGKNISVMLSDANGQRTALSKELDLARAEIITLKSQLLLQVKRDSRDSSLPQEVPPPAASVLFCAQQQQTAISSALAGQDSAAQNDIRTASVGSIVELSMVVGRQQSLIARLEDQLREQQQGRSSLPQQQVQWQQYPTTFSKQAEPISSSAVPQEQKSRPVLADDITMLTPELASILPSAGHSNNTPDSHARVKFADDMEEYGNRHGDSSSAEEPHASGYISNSQEPFGKFAARREFITAQMEALLDKHGVINDVSRMPPSSSPDSASNSDSAPQPMSLLDYGNQHLKKEALVIKEGGRLLVGIKRAIRGEQHIIAQMKIAWKNRYSNESREGSGSGSRASNVTTASINDMTLVVNDAIEQLRLAQEFFRRRDSKVNRLQKQLAALSQHVLTKDQYQKKGAGNKNEALAETAVKDVVKGVRRLLNELHMDAKSFIHELRSKPQQQPLISRDLRSNKGKHPTSSSGAVLPPPPPKEQGYYESDLLFSRHTADTRIHDHVHNKENDGLFRGMLFTDHPPAVKGEQMFGSDDPRIRPSLNRQGTNITRASYPTAASAQPFQQSMEHGKIFKASVSLQEKELLRQQIQKITSRQNESQDAYNSHASWLEQLTRQVGSFGSFSGSGGNAAANYIKPSGVIGERHALSRTLQDLASAKSEGASSSSRTAKYEDQSQDQRVFQI